MKLIHIADLHLGATCSSYAEASSQRRQQRDLLLKRIIDIIVGKADMLVVSGDLFDTHKPEKALAERVMAELSRFKSKGGIAVVVPGNHDEFTYQDSVFRDSRWDDCCLIVRKPKPAIVFDGIIAGVRVAIASCAYTGGETKASDLETFPDVPDGATGIMALHASLDMQFPGVDVDRAMRIKAASIDEAGYSYAALGHIHKRMQNRTGNCEFVYPGMIEPSGIGEIGQPEMAQVEIGRGPASVSWLPIPGLEVNRVLHKDVTGLTADAVVEMVRKEAVGADYLSLELFGTAQDKFSPERIRMDLSDHFKTVSVSSSAVGLDMGTIRIAAGEVNVRGTFIKSMLKKIDAAGEDEKPKLMQALWKGLDALSQEAR